MGVFRAVESSEYQTLVIVRMGLKVTEWNVSEQKVHWLMSVLALHQKENSSLTIVSEQLGLTNSAFCPLTEIVYV